MLIAGPTASGKSAVALEVAARLDGEIVNADSMQVYRELSVLTARPTREEQGAIPHQLYGFASVAEPFSVARWLELAGETMRDILDRGRVPILVGGTGLYFKALLQGLSDVPDIDAVIREHVRRIVSTEGPLAAHGMLRSEDPVMADRLQPGDGQRIARALEVIRSTGRSLASWQNDTSPGPLEALDRRGDVAKLLLMPPRDWLYERCDRRFDLMMERGALDEVRTLPPLDANLPALKALGVAPLRAHLEGACSLEEAVGQAKTATRQYAKRQLTWFRNQCTDWPATDEKESERIIDFIFSEIILEGLTK